MKIKLVIISVASLFTITAPSYGFIISCRSLIHPVSKNRILILGDSHIDDTPYEHLIDNFLSGLQDLQKTLCQPVNCFVELAEHHIGEKDTINGATFKTLAEEIADPKFFNNNTIKFIACDKRGKISDYVNTLFELLYDHPASTIMQHLSDQPAISIKAYHKMINRHIGYIDGHRRILGEFINTTILEPMKKSIINAQILLKNTVFHRKEVTSNLHDAILAYLSKESKGNHLKEKNILNIYKDKGLWSNFIRSIDHTFADVAFFCQVMNDQRAHSKPGLTILIINEIHAERVADMFYQIYYTLVKERSWEPPIKISTCDDRETFIDIPNYFQLLIYYSSLLVHPVTEKTSFGKYLKEYKEACKEKHKEVHSKNNELFSTEFKKRIDFLTSKSYASSLGIHKCNNSLCANKNNVIHLKQCGGCKTVSYCSVACQKNDWKLHKLVCKKNKSVKEKNLEE